MLLPVHVFRKAERKVSIYDSRGLLVIEPKVVHRKGHSDLKGQ